MMIWMNDNGALLVRGGRLLVGALAGLSAASALGDMNSWEGTVSDDWFTAANWSEEAVPGEGDPARIDVPAPAAVIDNAATATIGNFFVGSSDSGQVVVQNGASLNTSGTSVGAGSGSSGMAFMTGANTTWNNAGLFRVGHTGEGELYIENGAQLTNGNHARIGKWSSSGGLVEIRGPGSAWFNDGDLEVGRQANGSLLIEDQASMTNHSAWIGESSGTTGTVVVTGAGSSWASSGLLMIGHSGSGTLTISDGATVSSGMTSSATRVGHLNGSQGELLVTGNDSRLDVEGPFSVGHFGGSQGQATITQGAVLTGARPAAIASQSDSVGTMEVSGAGSAWELDGFDLEVGQSGTGSLLIADGASLSNRTTFVGRNAAGIGEITISGAGSEMAGTSDLRLAVSGTGTVTVGGNAQLAYSHVRIALQSGAAGHLVVGDGSEAGIINAVQIEGGSGESVLTLDHAAEPHYLTNDGTASGEPVTLAGELDLVHAGSGTTVIGGTHTHHGNTLIEAGTLQLDGSFESSVSVLAGGRLSGSGSISAPVELADGATLDPGNTGAGTLTTGSLTLAASTQLVFGLGAPGTVGAGVNDLIVVDGDLVLDGQLDIVNRGGFDEGSYTLITFTGELTDYTLEVVNVPGDAEAMLDTSTAGEIRLVVADYLEPEDTIFSDRFED
jgi:fibronectin-binding autotransporter adhesin